MQRKKLILDILARGDSSGGSRGGARVAPPPLFLDQTEARRAEKMFLGEGSLRWFPIAYIFLHLHSSNIKTEPLNNLCAYYLSKKDFATLSFEV